jgi:hypothetical protein
MRKLRKLQFTVTIRADVGSILYGIAAILSVLT